MTERFNLPVNVWRLCQNDDQEIADLEFPLGAEHKPSPKRYLDIQTHSLFRTKWPFQTFI